MNFCSRFLRLSVFPWCKDSPQMVILWWEWSGRLKWRATGLDASTTTHNSSIRPDEGLTLETSAFTVVIQPLSTRLIKPNFCFDLSHRRSTTVSLETRNPFRDGSMGLLPWHDEITFCVLAKKTLKKLYMGMWKFCANRPFSYMAAKKSFCCFYANHRD